MGSRVSRSTATGRCGYKVMQEAVRRARAGEGPTLIEAETYRYYAHTSDDNDTLYRSREEVETWQA